MLTEAKAKTGPRTPEGKRRSSMNALKHGLTAVSPQAQEIIAKELESNFNKVHADMMEYYRPQDNLEKELVRRVSECLVKLDTCRQMEKKITARNPESTRPNMSMQSLQRYMHSTDLQLHRTIATINKKREADRKAIQYNRRTNSHQSPESIWTPESPEITGNGLCRSIGRRRTNTDW